MILDAENKRARRQVPARTASRAPFPRGKRLARVKPSGGERPGQLLGRAAVTRKIALTNPGERDANLVVKIVGPRRIESGAGAFRIAKNLGGIALVLGNQERSARMRHVGDRAQ